MGEIRIGYTAQTSGKPVEQINPNIGIILERMVNYVLTKDGKF